jgi:hypothetical protein
MDAGTWGEAGEVTPGSQVWITEDGQRLTTDEAFRRRGEPAGPAGRKGISPDATAIAIAMAIYHGDVGIDVHLPYSETARRIANYATEHGLPGADSLDPAGGMMRGLIGDMVKALKAAAERSNQPK